jgi:hypothetical protein
VSEPDLGVMKCIIFTDSNIKSFDCLVCEAKSQAIIQIYFIGFFFKLSGASFSMKNCLKR